MSESELKKQLYQSYRYLDRVLSLPYDEYVDDVFSELDEKGFYPHKSGQIFLYENIVLETHYLNKNTIIHIEYPKLAVYLNQTTDYLEYVNVRRSWESRKIFLLGDKSKNECNLLFSDMDSILRGHDLNDMSGDVNLFVRETWNSYPSWKELKAAYEKTIWFKKTIQQKRNSTIKLILNK